MIACLLEKRAGVFTGVAHIVMEYINSGSDTKIITAPITAKNLRRHINECATVLDQLENIKEKVQ